MVRPRVFGRVVPGRWRYSQVTCRLVTALVAVVLVSPPLGAQSVPTPRDHFGFDGMDFPTGSYIIPMNQPYASFANTMLEIQHYPDLREYPGGPPLRPYDVTVHTLGYLLDFDFRLPDHLTGPDAPRVAMYKSWQEPIPEGWQRWVFDEHEMAYDTLRDADIRGGALSDYAVLVFQARDAGSIRDGYREGQVTPEYTGGLGDDGSAAVRVFVEGGGRLAAIEAATDFVKDVFGLRISNTTTSMSDTDFYIPGSILRLEVDPASELTEGMRYEVAAWYWRSSMAYDVDDPRIRVAARYGAEDPLLSGRVLGGERIGGKPAILEADIGEGSLVLFGFQPNYRVQTLASWPLLFKALRK